MSARTDRILTRLWLTLAAPLVLAIGLHLGSRVGLRRWPDLIPGPVAAASGGALSPGAMEPASGSVVRGCDRILANAKVCRFPPEN